MIKYERSRIQMGGKRRGTYRHIYPKDPAPTIPTQSPKPKQSSSQHSFFSGFLGNIFSSVGRSFESERENNFNPWK